ncbi:hypothetical protein V2G26_014868 [Clonostachys chloroleuca]
MARRKAGGALSSPSAPLSPSNFGSSSRFLRLRRVPSLARLVYPFVRLSIIPPRVLPDNGGEASVDASPPLRTVALVSSDLAGYGWSIDSLAPRQPELPRVAHGLVAGLCALESLSL